eukprot:15430146-Alexandrium_andersonii.AAC.1
MRCPHGRADEIPTTLLGKLIHLKWYGVNFAAISALDEKALSFAMQRQVCVEMMMSKQLSEGGVGSESSGTGASIPPVVLDFMVDI